VEFREGALSVQRSLLSYACFFTTLGEVGSRAREQVCVVDLAKRRIWSVPGFGKEGSRGSDVAKFWEKRATLRSLCRTGSDPSRAAGRVYYENENEAPGEERLVRIASRDRGWGAEEPEKIGQRISFVQVP
jgi:hypothetical protein